MKKLYPYAMALALMSGGAIYGLAQTAYRAQPAANAFFDEHDWEAGRHQAEEMGYRDGLHDGRSDFDHHHSFQPTHGGNYRHADRGFEDRFGDKGRYQEEYRHAYERGYDEAYHNGEHAPDHHEHDSGPSW